MKKHIFISALVAVLFTVLFTACKKDEPETVIVKQERGYKCENYTCKFVETGATYLTLLDCKSECADKRPGSLEISLSGPVGYEPYVFEIGIGYSSSDIAAGAYFSTNAMAGNNQAYNTLNLTHKVENLAPGRYYYNCLIRRGSYSLKTKAGVVDVIPGQPSGVAVTL